MGKVFQVLVKFLHSRPCHDATQSLKRVRRLEEWKEGPSVRRMK
jgi:hypothetical protein